MPLIKVQTSVTCERAVKEETVKELSALTAGGIGKPESYMAAVLEDDGVVSFGGELGPGAIVEVRSIGGLGGEVNGTLAQGITACLEKRLGVDPARVYITFFNVPASDWAWRGATFG